MRLLEFSSGLRSNRPMIWFAVRVPAQKEFIAEHILREEGGLNVYLPIEHKWRRRTRAGMDRRRRLVAVPLLTRYLFVGFETVPIPWHKIFCFDFVGSVVGSNGTPRPIAEPVMEHVRSLSASPLRAEPYTLPKLKIGEHVKIISGPFAENMLRVRRITDRKIKGILERSILGQHEVEVPLDQLEAAQ